MLSDVLLDADCAAALPAPHVLVLGIGNVLLRDDGVGIRVLRELERGCSLILFPEGTRGGGGEIAGFKSGLYQLCRERRGLEAVPVYLDNLHRVLPKGSLVPVPARSRVIFGSPLRLRSILRQ